MTTTSERPVPRPAGDGAGAPVAAALQRLLPDTALVTDGDVLAGLSHDEAEWADVGRAAAAVRARSVADVQAVVRACAELRVPVVPRGAGTGLSGGANAVDGCVVLDLSRLDRVLEVDADDMVAVVEPGVVNDDLKAAVAEHGLWYPPDPASAPWSTIGGNVSTNAGGLCCLKYGVTRDYVLGLQAVVGGPAGPYGTAVRTGRRTTKGVAGYDLTALLVGSEGTLGVVTEVTLRLRPAPAQEPRVVVGAFGSLVAAGEAVALVTRRRMTPLALELLDRTCLQAVEDWRHLGLEPGAAALLLAKVDTPGPSGDEEAAAIAAAFREAGALWAEQSTDDVEADALFAARKLAYPALERLGPLLTEDVCVPRSEVPGMLADIEAIGERHGIAVATIAHAGDGNLHPLLPTPAGDDDARAAAVAAFDDILGAALARRGTVSGEHGIGLLKREGMRRELDPGAQAMQRAVKQTLDPLDLFNPGKVVGE
jgi:glycolate oxidase